MTANHAVRVLVERMVTADRVCLLSIEVGVDGNRHALACVDFAHLVAGVARILSAGPRGFYLAALDRGQAVVSVEVNDGDAADEVSYAFEQCYALDINVF